MSVSFLEQAKAKILVVDDQPENLHLLSDTLTYEGYEVKGVINGEMALMVANSVIPDLILLDVIMPGLNGYQVCEKLKANAVTQEIPIIFLSASNDPIERVKALSVGGVDYIDKPFQVNEVLLRINNQLKLQAAQREILKLNTELEQRIQERTAQLEAANQELKYEIQEREQVSKLLQESEEKLESILNSLEEVVWSADVTTSNLLFLNPAAQKVYGRSVVEMLNNPDLRLESIHPEDRDRVELSLASSLNHKNDLEYRIVQPNGEVRWVWERSRLIFNQIGVANRRDGIIYDITERKKIEEELNYEAKHDSLTSLPNRAAFIERVEQALKQSKKDRDYLFAVLFIDLDRFKIVNDSLGHLVGDELLICVAKILTSCSRSSDFVARLGGDEFTILLNRIKTIDEANIIAERIQTKLTSSFCLQGHTVFTSASIGIVVGNHKYQDSSEILRDADIAMYQAKSQGKARHEVFDQQMYAETKELLEIENDLRQAVLKAEFILHYQPIISFEANTLYGFEALLRWNHPTKGLVYPDKFIHIAEETGLIVNIGEWVLQEACRQLYAWQTQYPDTANLNISVNIASQQIKDPRFLATLDETLAKTRLSGNALHLEITESTLMDYKPETINLFNQIRERGIKLNIDDFGTGYSSLQYLNRFPISILKIDRSFIQGMLSEKENFEIVKMIITLARTLKIDVIAEGVENLKQFKVLKTFNCQLGQGYLFSKPVDHQSAELLISKA
ncbi:MAG: EAL domain-containing protein [Pleurocapsa sp. MO_192.B19]|nr:EAL domain-containing protein [Pleurocapsa sp. MO_192.B19]